MDVVWLGFALERVCRRAIVSWGGEHVFGVGVGVVCMCRCLLVVVRGLCGCCEGCCLFRRAGYAWYSLSGEMRLLCGAEI